MSLDLSTREKQVAHYAAVRMRIAAVGRPEIQQRAQPTQIVGAVVDVRRCAMSEQRRARIDAVIAKAVAEQNRRNAEAGLPPVNGRGPDEILPHHRGKAHVRKIVMEVSAVSGVSVADIISHRRPERICVARHFIMYRARNETILSFPEIGRLIGRRDHTTILHGARATDQRIASGLIPVAWLETCIQDQEAQ